MVVEGKYTWFARAEKDAVTASETSICSHLFLQSSSCCTRTTTISVPLQLVITTGLSVLGYHGFHGENRLLTTRRRLNPFPGKQIMASAAIAIPQARAPSPPMDSRRNSWLSNSASSFQTAQSVSRSSSAHTLSAPTSDFVNPIHLLAQQSQEVHFVKVTDNKVRLETGHPPDSLFTKAAKHLPSHVPQILTDTDVSAPKVGPPPPSPPASEEHFIQDEIPSSQRELYPSNTSSVSFEPSTRQPRAGPSQVPHRASTDTKASFNTGRSPIMPHIPLTLSPDTPTNTGHHELPHRPARSVTSNMSSDGYLQPPIASSSRPPKRRNTIGAPTSPISPVFDDINADGELATEIQQQQEQIMRERLSKRAKAQQEAEAALTRSKSRTDPDRPLIGNWVKEGHENYVMMYNMLTGIRIAASLIAWFEKSVLNHF